MSARDSKRKIRLLATARGKLGYIRVSGGKNWGETVRASSTCIQLDLDDTLP